MVGKKSKDAMSVYHITYPIEELHKHGFAHIQVSVHCAGLLLLGIGVLSRWLSTVDDGVRLEISNSVGKTRCAIDHLATFFATELCHPYSPITGGAVAAIRRVEYEEGGFHYDIGEDVTAESYLHHDAVTIRDMSVPHSLGLILPFPLGIQPPTIVESWSDGKLYQAPHGYATLFFSHLTWHAGDNRRGKPRGVFMQGFTWTPESSRLEVEDFNKL